MQHCGLLRLVKPLSLASGCRSEPSHSTGYNPFIMCLAAPARVLAVAGNVASVDYGGVEMKCRLETLTEDVAVGDYLLIHTGFAIRRLSPEDGEETLRLFDELARSLANEAPVNDLPLASPATPETEENPVRPDSPVREQAPPDAPEAERNPGTPDSAMDELSKSGGSKTS